MHEYQQELLDEVPAGVSERILRKTSEGITGGISGKKIGKYLKRLFNTTPKEVLDEVPQEEFQQKLFEETQQQLPGRN